MESFSLKKNEIDVNLVPDLSCMSFKVVFRIDDMRYFPLGYRCKI